MDLREFPAVVPLHFFDLELEFELGQKPVLIEGYSEFLGEESFGEVRMAFSEGGIAIELKVLKSFEKASFPDVEKGDGFEFFIDTRGIRDALIVHKYCHHFIFLPKEIDGVLGAEVTRFKTNDKRELASKEFLKVATQFAKNSYTMQIFLPDVALYGFDPKEVAVVKMAYILHRGNGSPNHFPKSNHDLNLKDHPSLWAEVRLQ